MHIDHSVRTEIKTKINERAQACAACPKKGETKVEYDGKYHSGNFVLALLASVRVKISCGACNGQYVRPKISVVNHTQCPHFIRAARRQDKPPQTF